MRKIHLYYFINKIALLLILTGLTSGCCLTKQSSSAKSPFSTQKVISSEPCDSCDSASLSPPLMGNPTSRGAVLPPVTTSKPSSPVDVPDSINAANTVGAESGILTTSQILEGESVRVEMVPVPPVPAKNLNPVVAEETTSPVAIPTELPSVDSKPLPTVPPIDEYKDDPVSSSTRDYASKTIAPLLEVEPETGNENGTNGRHIASKPIPTQDVSFEKLTTPPSAPSEMNLPEKEEKEASPQPETVDKKSEESSNEINKNVVMSGGYQLIAPDVAQNQKYSGAYPAKISERVESGSVEISRTVFSQADLPRATLPATSTPSGGVLQYSGPARPNSLEPINPVSVPITSSGVSGGTSWARFTTIVVP